MIYSAEFGAMNALVAYLTDQCCEGRPELCRPKTSSAQKRVSKVS
jgi:hypothetical protein